MPKHHHTITSQGQDFLNYISNNPMPNPNASPANSSSAPQGSNSSPAQTNMPPPPHFQPYYPHPHYLQHPQPYYHHSPPSSYYHPAQPYYPQMPLQDAQYQNIQTPPESENDNDVVQETQPDTLAAKKGKGKATTSKVVRVPWTTFEEITLAERWVDATQNGIIGNSQTKESFWRNVQENYNRLVERPRGSNQISGKWSKMQKEVKTFCTIYDDYKKKWPSGHSDADIMAAARQGYKDQTKREFAHEGVWQVVRDVPKFFAPEGVMGYVRRRPQDGPINLDDDAPPQNNEENPN